MAIPKVLGTETEFGIAAVGVPDFNPVLSSSLLISTFAGSLRRIRWDYEQESPLRDARGFEPIPSREVSDEDLGLANVILPNGARYYVDHAHPEYSTPECLTPRALVIHDKAGERILERSMARGHRPVVGHTAPRDLQEQFRRQGQLLRHARELPRRPADAVRRHRSGSDPVLRVPSGVLRGGETGLRGAVGRAGPADLPAHAASGLLRDRGWPGDHAEAADHQHPRRAPRRPGEVPAAPRDHRRRQHVRGRAVPEGRHDRDRPQDDRGSIPPGPVTRRAGARAARDLEGRDLHRRGPAGRLHGDSRRSNSSGSSSSTRRSTSSTRTTPRRTERSSSGGKRC